MKGYLHHRAFSFTVLWTLGLLLLGSIVHATDSSLACPDWPTCFGTMFPEMTGGVFWEHLHRLVAGALVLVFAGATFLTWKATEPTPDWVRRACVAGIGLLVIQSVFGGLTVIFRLPDWISTTHLGLAFIFLGLCVTLACVTSPRLAERIDMDPRLRKRVAALAGNAVTLVFLQSLLGAYVRHSESGMACGQGILCNGGVVPPTFNHLVGVQYLHRVLGLAVACYVGWMGWSLARSEAPRALRRLAALTGGVVLAQVVVGFLSAATILAVAPVTLHTLLAASLLALCTALSCWGRVASPTR